MPWERRHRRLIERMGFFIVVGGVFVIIAVVMTFVNLISSSTVPSALH